MQVFDQLPQPFFVLAPMDDVTDTVFRRIVASCASPDLFFTEFVNVDGLQSPGRPRLLKKLRFTAVERPLIAQIWGKHPDNFLKTAQQLADGTFAREVGLPEGTNFAGIDLNMGCPDKTVVKNGACSALINNRELALEIIQATKQGAGELLPVSVKTRLGFNTIDLSWPELLLAQQLVMLTIHARTRKEMSKVSPHWEVMDQIRNLRDQLAPATKLVGNGDVMSIAEGKAIAATHSLDGIMIGRGVFHDPFVFAANSPWPTMDPHERLAIYRKQVRLFAETWQHSERNVASLNRFCKVYIQDFANAKELREIFMAAKSTDELLALIDEHTPSI